MSLSAISCFTAADVYIDCYLYLVSSTILNLGRPTAPSATQNASRKYTGGKNEEVGGTKLTFFCFKG